MATITNWNPYGVSLNIIASARSIKRTSSNQFTATLDVAWEVYYSSNKTNYGMKAASGGQTYVISSFGTKRASGSGSFTGTYSVTANSAATVTVPVVFTNYEENYKGEITKQSSKTINLSVTVPAWTSYTVSYHANGGSGAPSAQTKWRDQALKLSTISPTRTGYTFQGWATVMTGGVEYASGANYTSNSNITLYAVWKAITYTVSYHANGGSGAPSAQTKTHGVGLKLSTTQPSRTDYRFKGWGTSSSSNTVSYASGASYTANASITLYAVWELAYIRPRITSLMIDRCTSNGTLDDEGTYARVKFNWSSDKTVSSIRIQWKLSSASSYSNSKTVSASGTSGSVNEVVGSGALDGDYTYDFYITVTDSGGSSYSSSTLSGIAYVMDILANGDGLAIGKPAETRHVLDSEWAIKEQGTLLTDKYSRKVNLYNSTSVQQDYCATVIALCNTSSANTNVDSYSIGRITLHRVNGLQNPIMVDVAMEGAYGAANGINVSIRQLGWHTEYAPVPVTFTYNGVTYGGLKIRYADAALKQIEFHGASNFNIFALDYQNTSTGAVFYSEIYNSIQEVSCTGIDWARLLYVSTYLQTPNVRATGNYGMHFGVANNPELTWLYQAGGSTTGSKWFSPSTDGATLLGASGYRWGQIYSTNSSISSSDRNQKKDFTEFDERYEELFTKLKPQLFKFKDGTSDRKHCGFISQDVEEAMQEVHLTDKEFAGFCKDVKQVKIGENEKTGEVFFKDVYDEDGNPVYNYSLRYEEFIALNTHMIQKQRSEIEALKSEIEELKKLITDSST